MPHKQHNLLYTTLYITNSHISGAKPTSWHMKAVAANWYPKIRTWGDTTAALNVCPMLDQQHQYTAQMCAYINHPLGVRIVFLGFL